ncbi:MAG: aminopeptidase N [Proteobacteria bacterium]|nr:aminopeptidase N [Pseudomonadota bacterium]
MRDAKPGTIYLKDYQPPAYWIDQTELDFELHEDHSLVTSKLHMRRNETMRGQAELILHGQELELLEVAIDDRVLSLQEYTVSPGSLTISCVPDKFVLQCKTRIHPQDNTSLEGLYKSRTMFCTQCEAEGFRKITYYLDRPDVMSVFTVRIDAEQARYPVLLSNGNQLEAATRGEGGRHSVTWHDPFPKPAYLFALVAGELSFIEDQFQTCSGSDVCLRVYTEEKDINKCDHAMESLKKSMRWDEERFGREYDLDLFNIVAVDDFNMGAMENKSLNIFNTSCILATPETTTDAGFEGIDAIVAHEYFHNWSGNRVTCRDWFQLSLKEGFTVFRDAEYTSDMGSRTVKRVEDVTYLRTAQFAEDGGPMAHPIRPDSFIEISNFYTVTVYEKGAEVVRMIHTLLGAENFRKGSDLYFERHDGQAVTCEDFVKAMEDASGVDLGQFRNWYSQAGTPLLTARDEYDDASETYTLHVEQSCPPTPGQPDKPPFVIPLAMGLLGDAGNLPLKLRDVAPDFETADNTHCVLMVDKPEQTFVFENVKERPVPSLLRSFSAPVRLDYGFSAEDLYALMSRDGDGFVRWDSSQQLAVRAIHQLERQLENGEALGVEPLLPQACGNLLSDESLDPAMVADMLAMPSENYLAELASKEGGANVESIYAARNAVRGAIATAQEELLLSTYHRLETDRAYAADAAQIGARSLRNICLDYLCSSNENHLDLAQTQFEGASNMTNRLSALRVLSYYGNEERRSAALAEFYRLFKSESLVINQWFQLQASIPEGDGLARVQALMSHPDFDIKNPNKARSLIGAFANNNLINFHRADGEGYRYLADQVAELNTLNPQLASRLLGPLTKWRNFVGGSQLMRAELERLARMTDLSADVFEVVTKSLD